MLRQLSLLFLSYLVLVRSTPLDPTFDHVTVKGYSAYTLKFTKTIQSAATLKPELPRTIYDHLEFKNQLIRRLKKDSISDLDVDELTLEECQLESIEPGAFSRLPQLRKLSLKGNLLENVPEGVFNHLPLSQLDLSQNRIKLIERGALSDMPQLLNIQLADNLIDKWNVRWFHNVPLLTRVSMQNNSLRQLPAAAFVNLKGDKKFGSLKLTVNLIFSYNKINEIDATAFDGLKQINNLWLDHNELDEFPDNLLKSVEVQNLRLEHNRIVCLKGDLGSIIKAEMTHLDGNPFDCACVERIKEWAGDHDKNVDVFFTDMNCRTDRIKKKMTELEKRLKDLEGPDKEVEEVTKNSLYDQVEVF